MRYLIVDDYELIVDELKNELMEIDPKAECFCFNDPQAALDAVEKDGLKADVALLDIEIPAMNGLILSKKLTEKLPIINIIFVTGYTEYALDALKLYASGFITKPVSESSLRNALSNLRHPVLSDSVYDSASIASNIGAKIKELRTKAGLSINELASLIGVTYFAIYRWEKGERLPDVITLSKLAHIFGVNIEAFL